MNWTAELHGPKKIWLCNETDGRYLQLSPDEARDIIEVLGQALAKIRSNEAKAEQHAALKRWGKERTPADVNGGVE